MDYIILSLDYIVLQEIKPLYIEKLWVVDKKP